MGQGISSITAGPLLPETCTIGKCQVSDNPRELIDLLDSLLLTHLPTWDDCQQLLQKLLTTRVCERIQAEARTLVQPNGEPTANQMSLMNLFLFLT